jgi:hypothetical protein
MWRSLLSVCRPVAGARDCTTDWCSDTKENDPVKEKNETDAFADNTITEEELLLASRRSFLFLSACVDGEIADAKVADRILAARGLLEHAAKMPRLFDELLTGVVELSDEDVGLIASALE